MTLDYNFEFNNIVGTLRIFLTVTPTDGGSALRMRTWIDGRTASSLFVKTIAWILTGISASQLNADVAIIENKIRLRKPMIQPYDGPYNRVNAWLKQFYSEGTTDIFDCKTYKNDW